MVRPDAPLGAKSYWVLVADEYKAMFYARDKKYSPMQELLVMKNDTAREKTGDLISDRGGRSFDSHGQGRHTMAHEKSDPRSHSNLVFAKEIAERISTARQRGQFDRLIVVAAPRFLGVIRPALAVAGVDVDRTIDKEVTGRDVDFIQSLVDAE